MTPAKQPRFTFEPCPTMDERYYAGDVRNPHLESFIRDNSTPYSSDTDSYSRAAFSEAITSTKATALYLMHSYHQGKKPHDAIRQYVRHFTDEGDIVLDPFSGSGGTALAAILENRKAVAIDRSPAATFVTANYCTGVDPDSLRDDLSVINAAVAEEMQWLYGTRCERCDAEATVAYTVYSQQVRCPKCLGAVSLIECPKEAIVASSGKAKDATVCPVCLKKGSTVELGSSLPRLGHVPVAQCNMCSGTCSPNRTTRSRTDESAKARKYFEQYDIARLDEIDGRDVPYWVPPHKMMNVEDDSLPWGAEWRPGRNFRNVTDLFTKRNLWALALLRDAILRSNCRNKTTLLFALNAITLNSSKMYRYRDNLKGGFQQGTFYIPQDSQVINVHRAFNGKVDDLCRAIGSIPLAADVCVSTQSACELDNIPDDSIDYIFTDPPYGDSVQYGELNFVWEAWLGFDTSWHDDEIIVNAHRGTDEREWAAQMKRAMSECYRVLKPGRWLSLCFHDDEQTWQMIQDVMIEVGFVVDQSDKVLFIDTNQKSFNQLNADKSKKRDLVLNFRKPKAGDWMVTHLFIPAEADAQIFADLGRQMIRDYLTAHPGSPRDRIYDELVSRMVRRGEMESHDFGELLNSVAEEVRDSSSSPSSGRWYLRATADQIDKAEQEKEDAAAARLSSYILDVLEESPELEGVHFSELFEQLLAIRVEDRPRRLFENWLPEYFYKTTDGTWRPPADEVERQQKAAIREAGTLRRMKRFANALLEEVPVRDQDRPDSARTLVEWIRQCRRAGLYEQGRVIYEKGGLDLDRLNEDEQIEVEDDYRICVKRGSEEEAPKKSKSRKKKS